MAKRYSERFEFECKERNCDLPASPHSGIHGLCEKHYREWTSVYFPDEIRFEIDHEPNPHFGIKCSQCGLKFKRGSAKSAKKDGWIISQKGIAFCPGCPTDGD